MKLGDDYFLSFYRAAQKEGKAMYLQDIISFEC